MHPCGRPRPESRFRKPCQRKITPLSRLVGSNLPGELKWREQGRCIHRAAEIPLRRRHLAVKRLSGNYAEIGVLSGLTTILRDCNLRLNQSRRGPACGSRPKILMRSQIGGHRPTSWDLSSCRCVHESFASSHSSRSRIIGSTARARRAGTRAATPPTQSIVRMTPPRMTGSFGVA
jgi:hypothetical protein